MSSPITCEPQLATMPAACHTLTLTVLPCVMPWGCAWLQPGCCVLCAEYVGQLHPPYQPCTPRCTTTTISCPGYGPVCALSSDTPSACAGIEEEEFRPVSSACVWAHICTSLRAPTQPCVGCPDPPVVHLAARVPLCLFTNPGQYGVCVCWQCVSEPCRFGRVFVCVFVGVCDAPHTPHACVGAVPYSAVRPSICVCTVPFSWPFCSYQLACSCDRLHQQQSSTQTDKSTTIHAKPPLTVPVVRLCLLVGWWQSHPLYQ